MHTITLYQSVCLDENGVVGRCVKHLIFGSWWSIYLEEAVANKLIQKLYSVNCGLPNGISDIFD